jgi:hypothetical protein
MTRAISIAAGCLAFALVATGCDEGEDPPPTVLPIGDAADAFIESWCERLLDCDCPMGVITQADCRDQVEARIGGMRDIGEDSGLLYDGACLGATLDRLDDRGCGPYESDDDDGCQQPCNSYHGTRGVGDSCQQFGNYSDCAQGLSCEYDETELEVTMICRNPCARADVGESCDRINCVEGAWCEWQEAGGGVCRSLPKLGDECPQNQCADGLFCVVDPVDPTISECRAPAPLGESCMGHVQCESHYCPAGFCQELPGAGDECFGVCGAGLDCDFETNKCVEATPAVCSDYPI